MSRLVFGLHPVSELLRAGREVAVLYAAEGDPAPSLRRIVDDARRARVAIEERPRADLDALAEGRPHQGLVAVAAGDFPYVEVDDLVAAASARLESPLLVALDSVQDPQNLGAILRSAHVLGAHGVLLPKDRAAHVTPAVVKASAGASEHIPIALCTNLARALEQLKQQGLWIVGAVADTEGGQPPSAVDLAAPTVIVLGAEGSGLRPLIKKCCDLRVAIPMSGKVASLNVAAAGAVLLYEASRQRAAAR